MPKFDFEALRPLWAPWPEAAQMINAGNLSPACGEPFLIKVVRKAKEKLDPVADAALIEELDVLNRQEAQHCKMHGASLRMLRNNGYERTAEFERDGAADCEHLFTTKSLRFLLAYCLGFEALGLAAADFWLSGSLNKPLGSNAVPVEVYQWHYAEEYEHRSTIFRLYMRLYGKPALPAYLYRIAVYCYQVIHGNRDVMRLTDYLLRADRAGMSSEELRTSKRRQRAFGTLMLRGYARTALKPFSPFYNPDRVPPPPRLNEVLSRYSSAPKRPANLSSV
jgi:hypothetical protein